MTPRLVSLKYSKGLDLCTVFKKGYKYNGKCELKKSERVSACEAMHCNNANALHTLLLSCPVSVAGDKKGYIDTISCKIAAIVPNECHKIGAKSGNLTLKNRRVANPGKCPIPESYQSLRTLQIFSIEA